LIVPEPSYETVAVVGAGLMGTGIAHAFATSGRAVVLVDINLDAVRKAVASVGAMIADGVRRSKLTQADGERALGRISQQSDLAVALRGTPVDLLIETAAENVAVKKGIVAIADGLLPEHAVIATNTSALSVTEIGAVTRRSDRIVGMHFFNPVQKMKLVEVVRALGTSEETIQRARAWSEAIGKTAIVVNEAPGLTTSRMSALLGNEAMYMLMEGTASAEDIDTALRLGFNHPMGPLELGDLTGWDTRLSVLQYLHSTLGEKFRPCPLIIKIVKAGYLGRKAGRGVYEYLDGRMVPGSGLRQKL
jgi:3-hydroxybutyryl-CoA dehydrogenase